MDLSKYDQKYVRIKTIYGDTITGLARYEDREYLKSEWGGDEDGVFVEDYIIYYSQIDSIEEIEVHGTVELWTERLTLRKSVDNDNDRHVYSWVMDYEDVLVGTIGAYDYKDQKIEVGFSIAQGWQGRGFATEALKKVLEYLTENEKITCVTAWCTAENTGSRRVLEKSGMQLVRIDPDGLTVGEKVYDKMIYEYRGKP